MIKKINNVLFVLLSITYVVFNIYSFSIIGIDTYFDIDIYSYIVLLTIMMFVINCVMVIKNLLSKNKLCDDNKYNYLIFINNLVIIFTLIIYLIQFLSSKYLYIISLYNINELIFIINSLTYLYTILKSKNKKLHNNLIFLFLSLLFLYFNFGYNYYGELPKIIYFIIIVLLIMFYITYVINLRKKNKVLFSDKYNWLLSVFNILVIILAIYYSFYIEIDYNLYKYIDFIILIIICILLYLIFFQIFKNRKSKIKTIISLIMYNIMMISVILTILYLSDVGSGIINDYLLDKELKKSYISSKEVIKKKNDYSRKTAVLNYEFNYDLEVNNEKDLNNLIYTLLNSGQGEVTFKCNYDGCSEDYDEKVYSLMNDNLVSVFNQHSDGTYQCSINNYCELVVENKYSKKNIKEVEKYITKIYNEVYDSSKDEYENIKLFHDYLIDNYSYGELTSRHELVALDFLKNKSSSSQGYSEIMSLLLDKMGINNIIIEADYLNDAKQTMHHPWNFVYLNGKWVHLDAALDDSDNKLLNNYDKYKYFLIDNNTLKNYDDGFHEFDKTIYQGIK